LVDRKEKERAEELVRLLQASRPLIARDLPWINHPDPWAIYVSEVMLQQTQVARVVEPWRAFLQRFSTPTALAKAPLAEVLVAWQGLGFSRRARFLHEAAKVMVEEYGGSVPRTLEELRALPGIGEYSAASIASFAFGEPVVVLDTNVARIFSRSIAGRTLSIGELRDIARSFGDIKQSAVLNQSLLDFGAKFCRAKPECNECPAKSWCAWKKRGGEDPAPNSAKVSKPQSPFVGSRRQVRGQILKALNQGPVSKRALAKDVPDSRRLEVLNELLEEGMVEVIGHAVRLSGDSR